MVAFLIRTGDFSGEAWQGSLESAAPCSLTVGQAAASMDNQNTIPSQLSPSTIPSVLTSDSDLGRSARADSARTESNPRLAWLMIVVMLAVLIALIY